MELPFAAMLTQLPSFQINDAQVDLWIAPLDIPRDSLSELRALLAADEQSRAARFHFEKDRNRFIAARGYLRLLLADYTKQPASQLHFTYGPYGKPALSDLSGNTMPCFNLAYAEGLALFGVITGHDIGVDLEYIRPLPDILKMAHSYFSPGEIRALQALPREQQAEGFFNCWTRKEAFIKAAGQGMAIPLDQFEVSLAPGEPATLRHVAWDSSETTRWHLHNPTVTPGYVAAVVIRLFVKKT